MDRLRLHRLVDGTKQTRSGKEEARRHVLGGKLSRKCAGRSISIPGLGESSAMT